MLTKPSIPAALQVVKMITCGAASDEKSSHDDIFVLLIGVFVEIMMTNVCLK